MIIIKKLVSATDFRVGRNSITNKIVLHFNYILITK